MWRFTAAPGTRRPAARRSPRGPDTLDLDGDRDGPAELTIDGGNAGRIFNITAGSADLHGLILTNGNANGANGGAIAVVDAALSFSNGEIRDSAGAFGGGLYGIRANITLVNAEIRGNGGHHGGGGAIWNSDVAMVSATIADNAASGSASGLASFQNTVDLVNLTIANNSAGAGRGGAWLFETAGTVVQSAVTGNAAIGASGGIEVDAGGGLSIANSIIAANTGAGAASDLSVVNGASLSIEGTVLIGAAAAVDAASTLTNGGTQLALADMPETLSDVFVSLDGDAAPALRDAGGFVQTVGLKINLDNPAFASGDAAALPVDIHDLDGDGDVSEALPIGATAIAIRPGAPDLGGAPLPPFVDVVSALVTAASDVIDPWDGLITLREAIAFAVAGETSGPITFASGAGDAFEGDATITLNGTELLITRSIAIDGTAAGGRVTIDADGASRVLHIDLAATGGFFENVIEGPTITGGAAETGGGVLIENGGTFTFNDVDIIGNAATGDPTHPDDDGGDGGGHGGGVLATGGAQLLMFGDAIQNDVGDLGGGMASRDGAAIASCNQLITGNHAAAFGGGGIAFKSGELGVDQSYLQIAGAIVKGNSAVEGGATTSPPSRSTA